MILISCFPLIDVSALMVQNTHNMFCIFNTEHNLRSHISSWMYIFTNKTFLNNVVAFFLYSVGV